MIILYKYTAICFFTGDGHLGCCQFGAILNQAAMTAHEQVFGETYAYVFVSLGEIFKNGITGSNFKCMFNFIRNPQTVFKVAVPFCVSTSNGVSIPAASRPFKH